MSNVHHTFENLPTSDSEMVHQERNRMIDAVQIKQLVDRLKQVQLTARLASNVASLSGDADLYIQVRHLLTQMKDVYGNCAQAASQFTSATASVINNLKIAFDMLLQAQEQVAADILSDSCYVAWQAQKKVEKLGKDIKQAAEQTTVSFMLLKDEYIKHEASIKNLTEEYKSAATEVKDMENKRAKKFAEIRGTLFSSAGPTESDIERAENRRRYKQESLEKALEEHKKLGNTFLEQQTKMDENKDNWEEIIKGVTVQYIENVSRGLAEISSTLVDTAAFWDQIALHCEHLSHDKTKDYLNSILKKVSEEKRKEFCAMATFQNKLIKYYAQWLALLGVSFDFGRQVRIAYKGVCSVLAEQPSPKQGIINAKEIAKQLSAEPQD